VRLADPPLGRGAKGWKLRSTGEMMHQSCREHGLPGAREPSDAEAKRWLDQLA
jgi:hypothetical protein